MSELDWRDGAPWSRRFGDLYHSRAGGLDEKRHVFLEGNALRSRWTVLPPRATFTIAETGFGAGLNFLCAWSLWREVAPADATLHIISTEAYPLNAAELRAALDPWPVLAHERGALLARYDELPPGWHRLRFEGGRVVLTLVIGDARETLPEIDARVDAWFLDGFAPALNPALWSPEVFAAISALSSAGTTVATYTAAGEVRRGLEAVGFDMRRQAGFGFKREMLRGICVAPGPRSRHSPWLSRPTARPDARSAIVVGGGIAGSAAAAALAERGVAVTLIERQPRLAAAASGNAQAVLYAKLSAHRTVRSRLFADGYLYALRQLTARLPDDGHAWSRCGVLLLPEDAADAGRQQQLAALGWPASFLRVVGRDEAGALAGVDLPVGGLHFAAGGWAHLPALCTALVAHDGIEVRLAANALRFRRDANERWCVAGEDGDIACADVLVLANAADVLGFAPTAWLPLDVIRGQVTSLPATEASVALRMVLSGEGYVTPARAGCHSVGATFGLRDPDTAIRIADNSANVVMLGRLAPSLASAFGPLDAASLAGRAALRCVAPDHSPVVGGVIDDGEFTDRYRALSIDATTSFDGEAPWLRGLFVTVAHGSHGLISAPLAGEIIAALALGEPAPVARVTLRELSPPRFQARALKRTPRELG